MKKISIIVLALIVSLSFFGCDDREFSGVATALPPIDVDPTSALKAVDYYNSDAKPSGFKVDGAVVSVKLKADANTDTQGVEVTIPDNYTNYGTVRIQIELTSLKKGVAKVGFKNTDNSDIKEGTVYWEIYFGGAGSVGEVSEIDIPVSMLTAAGFRFGHNKYSSDTLPPAEYTLTVLSISIF